MTLTDASPATGGLRASEPYRTGQRRAQILTILLLAFVAVSLLTIFSSYLQISFLSDVAAEHGHVAEEAVEANDTRQGAVVVLRALVFVGCVVAFLAWVHRAYSNLPALGNPKHGLEYSPRWAVGGFFIPLVNLVLPYRIVKEIWARSDPEIRTEDDMAFTPPDSPPLILAWWVFWLAFNVVSNFGDRFFDESGTTDMLVWATKAFILANVLGIAAAVLAVLVVRSIERRQELRSRNVTYSPSMPPPPPNFTQSMEVSTSRGSGRV